MICTLPLITEKQAALYLTRSVSSLRRDRKRGIGLLPRCPRLNGLQCKPRASSDGVQASRNQRTPSWRWST
jgi:hypothetical protein